MKTQLDTIVALATPPGQSALAIIRLSGSKSITIIDEIFKGANLSKASSHTIHYGYIMDGLEEVDEVMVSVFKAPRTFTAEDSIEITCHGSTHIIQSIISLAIIKGARTAEPGEFTMRAFLNGRIDLAQAEAVADLIASENESSRRLALTQMRGGFSGDISALRQELIDFAAMIELELDFGEEDVEFADRTKLMQLIAHIKEVINNLLSSFHLGNVMKSGVATVIAGRPNAGKSTLLNALLNDDRAIVSDIAGTTRDTIEEVMNINGLQFRIIDTAGIRESEDTIERIGVQKALEKVNTSSVVLYIFDVTSTTPEDLWSDVDNYLSQSEVLKKSAAHLFVANKMDLNPYIIPESYYREGLISNQNLITASAKNQMNIEALKKLLYDTVMADVQLTSQTILTNARHYEALLRSQESLAAVENGLNNGITGDFIAMDIRQTLYHLGSITGEIYTDDLLDSIFTRFCIGK